MAKVRGLDGKLTDYSRVKPELVINKEYVQPDVWIGRLSDLLRIMEAMDPAERSAALNYVKTKFRSEWPSDSY